MRWRSELPFPRCNTYKQLKFNVGQKKKKKTVNLFLVRKDNPERSNKRSEIDLGLELFFLQRVYCLSSKTTYRKILNKNQSIFKTNFSNPNIIIL